MENEYLSLSQVMRDLIPLQEILKEIMNTVFDKNQAVPKCTKILKVIQ